MSKCAIWKFPLEIVDEQFVDVPGDWIPQYAEKQGVAVCLWAVVEPEKPKSTKSVVIVGTGQPFDSSLLETHQYVGSVQQMGGALVWHIYASK